MGKYIVRGVIFAGGVKYDKVGEAIVMDDTLARSIGPELLEPVLEKSLDEPPVDRAVHRGKVKVK